MINRLNFLNIRWIAYGLIGAAILGGGLWVRHEWNKGRAAIVEAQELRKTLAAERAAKVAADNASKGYQDELERLRNRPARVRTVRVCNSPASVPPAQPGSSSAGTPGGVGDQGTGPDIGPDLYALAARCDALTAQLRGLQSFAAER